MILCIDLGNTTLHAGLYTGSSITAPIVLQVRKTSDARASSDELGVFLRAAIRDNNVDPTAITRIGIASVVPDALYSVRGACQKYFGIEPFVLQAGERTGLRVRYRNPLEVGADRIANAIAATQMFPGKNLLIVDFGTATTFCAVTADRDYLGGVIVAGLRISLEALEMRTAKLPAVEIMTMQGSECLGKSTVESMQSGAYYGQLGAVREILRRLRAENFGGRKEEVTTIGTGGFAGLFEQEGIFDRIIPDLVLRGVLLASAMADNRTGP
ncbi:MAG: type III pantothenate kinase [Gammaproteobacteria bacterium]|jgi:type III pantothenate kinase|nr:type III pantothenate kinase [Gammaproteobacteria bacterium]NBP08262.1 type III pantothenate kinase [Gammaproteobacteria bacterium]NCW21306.1 type III pantothenate kinase [Gammaproteobacteria bacterium]NCW57683.1 type III pantothenate kinase [Gammaproteobacteria bacterium]NDA43582.1 type III pantothenate kinase [Gammaproteobacteria bacterium]